MRVSDTDYTLVIVTEDGTQYDISDFAEDLGWEENEKELASHLSFTVGTDNEELTALIKIGCIAVVLTDGIERTRGSIQRARVKVSGSKETRTVTAYDELYPLQTSEAQFLFPAGQSTKSILSQILDEWGVPLGKYTGANVTHEKLVFQNGSLAETILEILDDAEKKGGGKSVLRATQGQVEIVTRGGNSVVYELDENDTVSVGHETSITSLITRVKVVGQESDKEGVPPVEAVVNGLTQFGIRQKIYRREKDATVAEARTAAQKIIDEEGKIGRSQSVTAPDAPDLRKGDRVYVSVGEISGYFYANGVRQDVFYKGVKRQTLIHLGYGPSVADRNRSRKCNKYHRIMCVFPESAWNCERKGCFSKLIRVMRTQAAWRNPCRHVRMIPKKATHTGWIFSRKSKMTNWQVSLSNSCCTHLTRRFFGRFILIRIPAIRDSEILS